MLGRSLTHERMAVSSTFSFSQTEDCGSVTVTGGGTNGGGTEPGGFFADPVVLLAIVAAVGGIALTAG